MGLDVTVETVIDRPREEVAGFAMDPANDRRWIGGVVESRRLGEGPLGVGLRVERRARFLGRRFRYVTEVRELEAGRRLAMRSVAGPFPLRVVYEFEERGGGTLMRIRNAGEPRGFFRLMGPLLARLVRRRVSGDLERLRGVLEG